MRYLNFLTLLAIPALLPAQTPDPDRATLQALLSEVQQLRIAIERSTLLGARTQIAINMMQVQEGRAARISQDLDKVRKDILDIQGERPKIAERLKGFEEVLPTLINPNERRDIEAAMKQIKLDQDHLAAREQDRHARESELASQLQTEQSQLAELRARITEMQRALDNAIQQTLQHH